MTGRTGGRPCTADRADPLRSGHPVAAAASTREQAEAGRTLAATALEPMRRVAKVLRSHTAPGVSPHQGGSLWVAYGLASFSEVAPLRNALSAAGLFSMRQS
jgi:hypothetical protein